MDIMTCRNEQNTRRQRGVNFAVVLCKAIEKIWGISTEESSWLNLDLRTVGLRTFGDIFCTKLKKEKETRLI